MRRRIADFTRQQDARIFRAKREAMGLTVVQCATALGTWIRTLKRIEAGQTGSSRVLRMCICLLLIVIRHGLWHELTDADKRWVYGRREKKRRELQ